MDCGFFDVDVDTAPHKGLQPLASIPTLKQILFCTVPGPSSVSLSLCALLCRTKSTHEGVAWRVLGAFGPAAGPRLRSEVVAPLWRRLGGGGPLKGVEGHRRGNWSEALMVWEIRWCS